MARWSPTVDYSARPSPAQQTGTALSMAIENALAMYQQRKVFHAQQQRDEWQRGVADRDYNLRVQKEAFDQNRANTTDAEAREGVALERSLRGIAPTDGLPFEATTLDPATGMQVPRYTAIAGTRFSRDRTLDPTYIAQQRAVALSKMLGTLNPAGTPPIDPAAAALVGPEALAPAVAGAMQAPARRAEFEGQQRFLTGEQARRDENSARTAARYRQAPAPELRQLEDGTFVQIDRSGRAVPVTGANGQPARGARPGGAGGGTMASSLRSEVADIETAISLIDQLTGSEDASLPGMMREHPGAVGLQNLVLPGSLKDIWNPGGAETRATLAAAASGIRKALAGTAFSATEKAALEPMLPQNDQVNAAVRSKLKVLRNMMRTKLQAIASTGPSQGITAAPPSPAAEWLRANGYDVP